MDVLKKLGGSPQGGNLKSTSFFLILNAAAVLVGALFKDQCNNGAAEYLLAAGALGLAVSALTLLIILFLRYVFKGGLISGGEGCALGAGCCLYFFLQLAIFFTQVIIMFWGFAVILPAYSTWTYDEDDMKNDNSNYCAKAPFMFAFVITVIKCVLFVAAAPVLLICCCCCAGAAGVAAASQDSKA